MLALLQILRNLQCARELDIWVRPCWFVGCSECIAGESSYSYPYVVIILIPANPVSFAAGT